MHATLYQILQRVVDAVEALSFADDSSSATSYKLRDRPDQREHLGVSVWCPDTANTDSVGSGVEWLHDLVEVRLTLSVPRTVGQLEMIRLSGTHEERIRLQLNTWDDLLAHQPVHQGTRREITEPGWMTVVQTFRIRRLEQRS
jgi:hypothetical protein